MPSSPSRRSVLRLLAAGAAGGLLVGCSEDELPRRGPTPTQQVLPDDPATWPVDSELLLAVREELHATLAAALAVPQPRRRLTEAVGQWRAQLDRLEELVSAGGVPLPDLPALPTDDTGDDETEADDAAETTGPGASKAEVERAHRDLAKEVRASLPGLVERCAGASALNLPMLLSLATHRADTARLLGAPVDWQPLTGPEGAAAVPLLSVTRPAIFGLEVVAARSSGEERATYETVLGGLRSITRQLTTLAGPAAPVAPMGYDLPEPLDDEKARKTLARELVMDIPPTALSSADRVLGQAEPLLSIVRVAAESIQWGRVLDARPETFPGMTLP